MFLACFLPFLLFLGFNDYDPASETVKNHARKCNCIRHVPSIPFLAPQTQGMNDVSHFQVHLPHV
ncbi:hypothetical protein Mapa_016470 [Marchantia paleacea]|nr:hypothetical protein Mapa_016470 [Marchantia paleacea]